jgi:hypothetical protein
LAIQVVNARCEIQARIVDLIKHRTFSAVSDARLERFWQQAVRAGAAILQFERAFGAADDDDSDRANIAPGKPSQKFKSSGRR